MQYEYEAIRNGKTIRTFPVSADSEADAARVARAEFDAWIAAGYLNRSDYDFRAVPHRR